MWIAFMLLCTSPAALSCEVMTKTEGVFTTEQACAEEALIVARYFQSKGYLAVPECVKIKMGVSL
tara:strand:+ start:506 stop:700 length:195 start_codon:yes stop_codon:yes gene_type:complete